MGARADPGQLYERVLENVDNDAVEVMWGSPGTMLAARATRVALPDPRGVGLAESRELSC